MGIVFVAELFPVRGALIDVALALSVFFAGEAARRAAARSRALKWAISEALAFESYYRERPPKAFAYYVFYPLLFPYWLANAAARREFLMFRGYTVGSFVVLLVSLAVQYVKYWRPELSLRDFFGSVLLTLAVETVLVLSFLMPIATTVVWYHSSYRRRRLLVLLVAGMLSAGAAFARIEARRDPIVSLATRERVRLRTRAASLSAHRTLLAAARAATTATARIGGLEGDGKIEGEPLGRAREALQAFYKSDEAFAFDLWGTPRKKPRIVVLYFESQRKKPPIWVGVRSDGSEIETLAELPSGALRAMKKAADGTDPLLPVWQSEPPRTNASARKSSETAPRPSGSASISR
jgi:hypothetical protein